MTTRELTIELDRLRLLPAETEVVEFKEAKNNFDFSKLGKYFSALSNEANLKSQPYAWLVFGIEKKKRLNEFEERHLKAQKLIEGRKPNYFIALRVAQTTGQKATYTKNKAFDKAYYLDLIEKALTQHQTLNRKDVDELLWNKLPEWMDDKQRKYKIGNLLSELRRGGKTINIGSDAQPIWTLKDG